MIATVVTPMGRVPGSALLLGLVFKSPWAPDAFEPVFVLGTILVSLAILLVLERWWSR